MPLSFGRGVDGSEDGIQNYPQLPKYHDGQFNREQAHGKMQE